MRNQHMHEFILIHYVLELCWNKPRSLSIVQISEHLWTSSCNHAVPQKRSRFVRGFRGTSHGENSCRFYSGDHANQAHWGAKARDFGNQEEDQGVYGRNVARPADYEILFLDYGWAVSTHNCTGIFMLARIHQNWLHSATVLHAI